MAILLDVAPTDTQQAACQGAAARSARWPAAEFATARRARSCTDEATIGKALQQQHKGFTKNTQIPLLISFRVLRGSIFRSCSTRSSQG
jgi:hypothetical protein